MVFHGPQELFPLAGMIFLKVVRISVTRNREPAERVILLGVRPVKKIEKFRVEIAGDQDRLLLGDKAPCFRGKALYGPVTVTGNGIQISDVETAGRVGADTEQKKDGVTASAPETSSVRAPCSRAISQRRSVLELCADPATSTRSQLAASSRTAFWRVSVAWQTDADSTRSGIFSLRIEVISAITSLFIVVWLMQA